MPAEEPTLAEVVKRYLDEYGPSALSPSTLYSYSNRLSVWWLPRLGGLPVSKAFDVARAREIDVAMVNDGLTPGSRRIALNAFKSVGRFAVEARILNAEPKYLAPPKVGERVPSAPCEGDVAAVIDAASCLEHRLVILLAAHAGLRKGEIRGLRCADCEMARDRLVVRRSRWKHHTKATKSGDEREVPLTPQLRAALLAAGVDKRPAEECAALNRLGKPWGHRGPYDVFQSTLRRVKLPRVRLHALRAFFVTTLLNGHVPVHVVRKLVGHGNLATTQKYAAVVAESRGEAVGVLERSYEGARGAAHAAHAQACGAAHVQAPRSAARRSQPRAARRRGPAACCGAERDVQGRAPRLSVANPFP